MRHRIAIKTPSDGGDGGIGGKSLDWAISAGRSSAVVVTLSRPLWTGWEKAGEKRRAISLAAESSIHDLSARLVLRLFRRWSASASYVFYADNKWNVAFGAGFRRSASREPLLRRDLWCPGRRGAGKRRGTRRYFGMVPCQLQRPALSGYRVFRRASKGRVPPRCYPASLSLSLSFSFPFSLFLSRFVVATPTYQSTLTSKSAGLDIPSRRTARTKTSGSRLHQRRGEPFGRRWRVRVPIFPHANAIFRTWIPHSNATWSGRHSSSPVSD